MKILLKSLAITALLGTLSACQSTGQAPAKPLNFKEGDKLQTLVNVHGDFTRKKLYAFNYQLADMIPVCSEVTVNSISEKNIVISYKGQQYNYTWDKYTKKAGQSLAENFDLYFGKSCDKAAMKKLSKLDQKGIKEGQAKVGMSKQGVIFAMGYPPIHATPSTKENYWLYWRNRFGKRGIQFSDKGKVKLIK